MNAKKNSCAKMDNVQVGLDFLLYLMTVVDFDGSASFTSTLACVN